MCLTRPSLSCATHNNIPKLSQEPSLLHALGALALDSHTDVRLALAPLHSSSSHRRLTHLFEAADAAAAKAAKESGMVRHVLPPPPPGLPGLGVREKGEEKEGEREAVVGAACGQQQAERVCDGKEGEGRVVPLSSSPASSCSSASSLITMESAGSEGEEGEGAFCV